MLTKSLNAKGLNVLLVPELATLLVRKNGESTLSRYPINAVHNDMRQVERCRVDRVAMMQKDGGLYQFNYNYARMQRFVPPRANLSYK